MLRWLILFYLAFTVGVGGLKWVLQADTAARAAQLEDQQQATRRATHDANALLVLTHEYMLRGTERAASQWQSAHRALTQAVTQASPIGSSDADFDELKDATANLPTLFSSLARDMPDLAPALNDERRIMLVDQILSETRLVSDLAYRRDGTLFEQLQREAATFRQRDGVLNWLWLASSLFLAWLLLVRVLRPVALLRAAAQSVQAGDLQARCNHDRRDELGQLADSFNAMTDTLARAKERLALAVGSAAMGVWEYDLKAGSLVWDDQMFALYGRHRTGDAEPYALWSSSLHPDDRAASEQASQDAISGKKPFDTQFRILLPDGSVRHLKAAAHVVRDATGTALRMIGVNTDVTDQVLTAAALQEQTALLRRVGQLASIGGWRLDLSAGTLFWDDQTRRIHEVPAGFVPNVATAVDFYAPEHRATISNAVRHAVETGEGWDLELRVVTFTGRHIWVRALGEVECVNGQAAFLVGAFQDITDRQQAALALQEAKTAAESASAAKSAFLANMSHEIRTPLNAVLGMHRLLESTELGPKQRDLLAKAEKAGRSLMDILNDVLDLAKIEAGEMSLQSEVFDLNELFDELSSIFGSSATGKGLSLSAQIDAACPRWLVGDRMRVRQVLSNLVGNAIKFTAEGGVLLRADVIREEDRSRLRLIVRDTGIGIAPDSIARLFDPFVQEDHTTTRRFGGTGLGLSIVRNLAELMGGRASVHSNPGRGSEFTVVLPLHAADARVIEAAQDASRPIAVGMLCGNHDLCDELKARFQALGWTAVNLDTAPSIRPDVLLVDAGLGSAIQTSQSTLDRIRSDNADDLPVILVGDPVELENALHTGLTPTRTVEKPLDASQVFNAVIDVLSATDALQSRLIARTQAIEGGRRWLQGARVLVVDDADINLEIAVELLQSQGAVCHTASDGREALLWLEEHPRAVDAVLMDVQMPVMDGLQAAQLIKQHEELKNIPVIALTAGVLYSERERARRAGMDDFLTKPLEPTVVVKTLRRLIRERTGRSIAVDLGSSPSLAPSTSSSDDWPCIEGIDSELAQSRTSHDAPLFRRLLALMARNYTGWTADWRDRARREGAAINASLCMSLHKLRGSAGMMGATALEAAAAEAESALESSDSAPLPWIDRVDDELARLLRSVALALTLQDELQHKTLEVASSRRITDLSGLNQLRLMLRTHDLDAVDLVQRLRDELIALLSPTGAESLSMLIDGLDFEQALAVLEEGMAAFDEPVERT